MNESPRVKGKSEKVAKPGDTRSTTDTKIVRKPEHLFGEMGRPSRTTYTGHPVVAPLSLPCEPFAFKDVEPGCYYSRGPIPTPARRHAGCERGVRVAGARECGCSAVTVAERARVPQSVGCHVDANAAIYALG